MSSSNRLPGLIEETSPLLSDDDNEDGDEINYNHRNRTSRLYGCFNKIYECIQNPQYMSILKCSIAYLLASMAVYYSVFSKKLGKSDMKHLAATTAVYFHPARTKGSMHQSIMFVCCSMIYSLTVSILCMTTSSYFFNSGHKRISDTVDLIFVSLGLAFISFMKQKVNKQTFNTACTLAATTIISVIVKEGSVDSGQIPFFRIKNVYSVIVAGITTSVLICYTFMPTNATDQLKITLDKSTDCCGGLLKIICQTFLKGESLDVPEYHALRTQLTALLKRFKLSVEEAQYELYLQGRENELNVVNQLYRSLCRLSQHSGGLKSSIENQWELLQEYAAKIAEEHNTNDENSRSNDSSLTNASIVDPPQLFNVFVYFLGGPMKSYCYTMCDILDGISFDKQNSLRQNHHYRQNLFLAQDLFAAARSTAVQEVYKHIRDVYKMEVDVGTIADKEEVASCCGNFSAVLQKFGAELDTFLSLIDEYDDIREAGKSWNWMKFWKRHSEDDIFSVISRNQSHVNLTNLTNQEANHMTTYVHIHSKPSPPPHSKRGDPDITKVISRLNTFVHNSTTFENEKEPWNFRLYKFLRAFKRVDIQFGIRVGFGAFFLALPSFLDSLYPIYSGWRGEWALVTYSIIMNKSLGGTSMTVKWRVMGTFMGATTAYITWTLFEGDPCVLALMGFLLSIPCFHVILYWKSQNAFGRFILLTYNLSALYSYSLSQDDEEDDREGGSHPYIGEIAFHRFVAVMVGIIWALIITTCVLPNTARKRLRQGLCALWLQLGISVKAGPLSYSSDVSAHSTNRLKGVADISRSQAMILELEMLLSQAPLEVRIKGKFPQENYRNILKGTQRIVDALQNLNTMITLSPALSPKEIKLLEYTSKECRELENRIFLVFYMLASAIRLGFPIPATPASTVNARDRMLAKLNEFKRGEVGTEFEYDDDDFVLCYLFVLASKIIARELDLLIDSMTKIFSKIDMDDYIF